MRAWVGATIGAFALLAPSVAPDDRIEAVEVELILGARSLSELFDRRNRPIAERGLHEEPRMQLEATERLSEDDRQLVDRFIKGLLLSHEAKRLAA